jgi:hypothetical protein
VKMPTVPVPASQGHAASGAARSARRQRSPAEPVARAACEAGTRPVGNDQLNDMWREVQLMACIARPVTVHGIRHSFHDLARQQVYPMRW